MKYDSILSTQSLKEKYASLLYLYLTFLTVLHYAELS